jgi:hypothetical protein
MKSCNPQCKTCIRVNQSKISNSRFNRSTMMDKAALQFSRSAFPNLTPRTSQFASSRELRALRSTKTPMKASQLGSDLLTAVAIATSKVAHLICSRELNLRLIARDRIIHPPLTVQWSYCRKGRLGRCQSASKAVTAEETQSVTTLPQYLIS